MERTQIVNGRADGTDRWKDITQPVFDGRIKKASEIIKGQLA